MRSALLLIVLAVFGNGGAPPPGSREDVWRALAPPLRTFGAQEGPPNNTVYTITEDRAGRLWVGTQDGAALYNGRTWTPMALPKESASQFIRALAETPDGARWFGTEGAGLWRLHEGKWQQFKVANGFPSNTVNFLTEVDDGQGGWVLWAATATGGVARWDGSAWTVFDLQRGLPSLAVWKVRELRFPNGSRELWATTTKGFAQFDGERWHAFGPSQGWPEGEGNDIAVGTDAEGRPEFWLSIWGKGMCRGTPGSWEILSPDRGTFPSAFPVQCLIQPNPKGRPLVWASTYDRGIAWLADGVWRQMDTRRGLPADGVYFAHAPKTGRPTLWVGMRGGGLAGLDLGGWYHAGVDTGLPSQEIHAFAETPGPNDGTTFWIGTSAGLARWEQGAWRVDTTRQGLPNDHITSLLAFQGPRGPEFYAGTMRGLARRTAAGRWETLFKTQGLQDQRILCLQEGRDEQGRPVVWAGTEKGLLRHGPDGQTFFAVKDGLPDARVFSLGRTVDPDGTESLWVGTRGGGIGRLRKGAWTHYQEPEGLRNLSVFCFREATTRDGRRWLWAGTFGGGLVRFPLDTPDARQWESFWTENLPGLPSNVIVRIEADAQGHLYLATQRGVARLSFQHPSLPARPSRVESFSHSDGLPSVACNYGASIIDHHGRVWVATNRGAAALDPVLELPPPDLPALILHSATVRGRPVTLNPAGTVLGHRDNQLAFEMSLPLFYREDEVRYRSQLKGLEDEPTPWSTTVRRELAVLPPGHYVLRLEARDSLGRMATPLEFPITLRPTPWRSGWAITLYVLLLGGLLLLVYHVRTRLLRQRNLLLEARVQEATLALNEQNRALEHLNEEKNQFMGIAAHDLKNPLNAVVLASQQIAMGDMDPDELNHFARMIERAARQMAELIKNMLDVNRMDTGQMQLTIGPVDLSDLVAEVAEAFASQALAKRHRLKVEAGRGIGALADPLHLRDVLENFVSNAIKFMPPGPPIRNVTLRAFHEGGRAVVEVSDEGPGFTAADKAKVFGRFERLSAKPTGGEGSTGLGLSIVKRLVEAMDGTITLESEPGQGATFRITLPEPPAP